MKAIFIGYLAASVWVCLPFIYWITAPGAFKSREGRALMMLLGSTAAVFFLIATSNLFGDYEWRELVRLIIYGSVLVSGVRLAILFFQLRFSADWAKKKERN